MKKRTTRYFIIILSIVCLIGGLGAPSSTLYSFDVVVVGGGLSGVSAAIQAAELGSKVAIIEETDWVGGQMTAAGVSSIDEGNTIYDAGVFGRFIAKATAYYGTRGLSMWTCLFGSQSRCMEPHVAKVLLEQMIAESDTVARTKGGLLQLFLLTKPQAGTVVKNASGAITSFADQQGRIFTAKVFIDATEYGDFLKTASIPYRVGNSKSTSINTTACVQAMTYNATIRKYSGTMPADFLLTVAPPGYSAIVEKRFSDVVQNIGRDNGINFSGVYPVSWPVFLRYRGAPDSTTGINASAANPSQISKTGINWGNALVGNDYPISTNVLEDPTARTNANCEAKLRTIQFLYYIQNVLQKSDWSIANDEGYANSLYNQSNSCATYWQTTYPAYFAQVTGPTALRQLLAVERHMPLIPYVREARRLLGKQTLVGRDIYRAVPGSTPYDRNQVTSVALGDYNVDLHDCSTNSDLEPGLETTADIPPNANGGRFQIPFDAFIPETTDGFVAAEKNLSMSRLVNGATREHSVVMYTGQAAGTIAALAVAGNIQPRAVRPVDVQVELVKSGLQISRLAFTDVQYNPQSEDWRAVELATGRGLLVGYGDGRFGVSDLVNRGQAAIILSRRFAIPTNNPSIPTFSDTPASAYYFPWIEGFYKAGIIGGCYVSATEKRYCPEDPIQRAQMAVMLQRLLKLPEFMNPPIFTDIPYPGPVPPPVYPYSFVQSVSRYGYMNSCDPNGPKFCPFDLLNRVNFVKAVAATLQAP